jgi:hypothetical protein
MQTCDHYWVSHEPDHPEEFSCVWCGELKDCRQPDFQVDARAAFCVWLLAAISATGAALILALMMAR